MTQITNIQTTFRLKTHLFEPLLQMQDIMMKRRKFIVNRNLISIFVIIDLLDPLNIEARYPSYKEKLMKSLTQEKCITLIEQTKKLQQWIKTKL